MTESPATTPASVLIVDDNPVNLRLLIRILTDMGHQVRPGDSIQSIATRYGTTVEALAAQNGIQQPYYINVGQRLVIPPPGPEVSSVAQIQPPLPFDLATCPFVHTCGS